MVCPSTSASHMISVIASLLLPSVKSTSAVYTYTEVHDHTHDLFTYIFKNTLYSIENIRELQLRSASFGSRTFYCRVGEQPNFCMYSFCSHTSKAGATSRALPSFPLPLSKMGMSVEQEEALCNYVSSCCSVRLCYAAPV